MAASRPWAVALGMPVRRDSSPRLRGPPAWARQFSSSMAFTTDWTRPGSRPVMPGPPGGWDGPSGRR